MYVYTLFRDLGAKLGVLGHIYKYWLELNGQIKEEHKKMHIRVCLPTWKICA